MIPSLIHHNLLPAKDELKQYASHTTQFHKHSVKGMQANTLYTHIAQPLHGHDDDTLWLFQIPSLIQKPGDCTEEDMDWCSIFHC